MIAQRLIGLFLFALIATLFSAAVADCSIPDLKAECEKFVNDKFAKLEGDFKTCAAGLPEAVNNAVDDKLAALGCYPVDGGPGWSCAGAEVCR